VGIIGRNGSGKSTLLKILSRITEPTSGRVTIHGRVGSLLEVGTGFHPELTGRENVYLNGAIIGMSRREIRRRFDEIVAFSEVERFLDTPVKHYSSGMYVRLAFAVAAHLEPEVLLVDEVLAVGDAAFQRKCLGKMSEAAQGGRTVVYVSHGLDSVKKLCRRALWLDRGLVKEEGSAASVIDNYLGTDQGVGLASTLVFPSDPTKSLQITRVVLGKPPSTRFAMAQELLFQLELVTREVVPDAYVTVNILAQVDRPVYWTSDIGSGRFRSPAPGKTVLTCRCPPFLLTPGRYSANFAVVTFSGQVLDHFSDQQVAFDIVDDASVLAKKGIRQPGITAVQSAWSILAVAATRGEGPG
jgi:lipopolysaccharide transport system ATP-binding protein